LWGYACVKDSLAIGFFGFLAPRFFGFAQTCLLAKAGLNDCLLFIAIEFFITTNLPAGRQVHSFGFLDFLER
jgi:hypothetical protein